MLSMKYDVSLALSSIQHCQVCRKTLNERLFRRNVTCSISCLHYLLADRCDSLTTDKLPDPKIFQQLPVKTVKFSNSFISHCLDQYE